MAYKGGNFYQGFVDFVEPILLKENGFDYLTNIKYHTADAKTWNEIYQTQIVPAFVSLSREAGWYLTESLRGWEGLKHWDLWSEDWHYLCKNRDEDHIDGDGWFCFPADMLHWHVDGFYCEDCLEWRFEVDITSVGRSLEREIRIAKQRNKSYRTLPSPVLFANEYHH